MRWKDGFTIIEVLVALSITGLIFSAGYVSFRDFSRRQVITGAVRSIRGDLRLTQEYSLIGKKPDDIKCTGANILDSYGFFVSAADQYIIRAYCSGGVVDVKTVDLANDLEISSPFPNPILFKALGAGTNLTAEVTITILQLSTQNSSQLSITPGGEIK